MAITDKLEYSDLSDFMSRTKVANNSYDDRAVIVVEYQNGAPMLLPGFTADIELSDFEIYELGWSYLNMLLDKFGNNNWPPLNEL